MDGQGRLGTPLAIVAPSGAGKSSLCRALMAREPDTRLSVSVTTREPRAGERDGVDYHFITVAAFEQLRATEALLESATVFGHGYGTPRRPFDEWLAGGRDVLLDIDCQGYRQLRHALGAALVGVFVLPPDWPTLETRLRGRGTEDGAALRRRLGTARSEISRWREFDHLLVNDDFDACVQAALAVLRAARSRTLRRPDLGRLAERLVRSP